MSQFTTFSLFFFSRLNPPLKSIRHFFSFFRDLMCGEFAPENVFSRVNSPLNLLYRMMKELTFPNFFAIQSALQNDNRADFSELFLPLVLCNNDKADFSDFFFGHSLYRMMTELTFFEFLPVYICGRCGPLL